MASVPATHSAVATAADLVHNPYSSKVGRKGDERDQNIENVTMNRDGVKNGDGTNGGSSDVSGVGGNENSANGVDDSVTNSDPMNTVNARKIANRNTENGKPFDYSAPSYSVVRETGNALSPPLALLMTR